VSGIPAGTIVAFGGSSVPAGWMLCDGRAVSRSTFADLFSAIGTQWGGGNGTSTFNVPNLIGGALTNLAPAPSSGDLDEKGPGGGASAFWIIKI